MTASPPHQAAPSPARVLVVDDHEWIRDIAVQVVRQTLPDAQILITADGLAALQAFQTGGADFVVTNHHMPHMNGAELIRELRRQAPKLPIVMISIDTAAKSDAESAGATWFLTKEQLMERLPPLLRGALRISGTSAPS